MSLKDEYKNRVDSEIKSKEEYRYYKALYDKMPYSRHERTFLKDNLYRDYYNFTQPLKLDTQFRVLIDEAISLIESSKWSTFEPNAVSSNPNATLYCYVPPKGYGSDNENRIKVQSFGKYKWSDGSIHFAAHGEVFHVDRNIKGMFKEKKKYNDLVARSKEAIKPWIPMRDGNQDYVIMPYFSSSEGYTIDGVAFLLVFKDGTIFNCILGSNYRLYKCKYPLSSPTELKEFLLNAIYKINNSKNNTNVTGGFDHSIEIVNKVDINAYKEKPIV